MNEKHGTLLVLTQYYSPEPNFITADVAAGAAEDFSVVVVTAHPNYPEGKFYAGTKWWRITRSRQGRVTVWRLPMIPYHGRSIMARMVSYLSFTIAAILLSPILAGKRDVVWVYQTPFILGFAAIFFKYVFGAKVVFTYADLWPESFLAAGVMRPGVLSRALFSCSRLINNLADLIICSTRGTMQRYANDGVESARLRNIPVWVESSPRAAVTPLASNRRIVYAGNIGPAQHLDTVVRAAAELEKRGCNVRFDFYGSGSSEPELRHLVRDLGVGSVTFHGRIDSETSFVACSQALGQIVLLRRSPMFKMTLPSKISFSCAAGSPILYGLEGEAADVLAESGGGIPFDPDNLHSLVAAVEELLALPLPVRRAMTDRLQAYYDEHFDKTRLLLAYRELFRQLCERRPATETHRAGDVKEHS